MIDLRRKTKISLAVAGLAFTVGCICLGLSFLDNMQTLEARATDLRMRHFSAARSTGCRAVASSEFIQSPKSDIRPGTATGSGGTYSEPVMYTWTRR